MWRDKKKGGIGGGGANGKDMRGRKDSTSEKFQEFRLAFFHCIPYTMRASEEEKSVEMRLEFKKRKIKGKTNLLKCIPPFFSSECNILI